MRPLILAIALSLSATAQERLIDRAPTPYFDGGKRICLEVVIFKLTRRGTFPTLVFNHGSTGGGGTGTSKTFQLPQRENGHRLIDHPELWGPVVSRFLETVKP